MDTTRFLAPLRAALRFRSRPRGSKPTRFAEAASLQRLCERAPLGVAEIDPDGRFLHANPAFQAMLGYSEEELRTLTYDFVTFPDDRPASQLHFRHLLNLTTDRYELEKRYVRKNGGVTWAHVVAVGMTDGGRLIRAFALVTDITQRKQANELLKESEEKFRWLYWRTPAMMHSIDRDGRLVSVSDLWLATLGYKHDEVLGRRSVEFLTPESRKFATDVVLPAFWKTGKCTDVPYQLVKKNGEIIDVLLSSTCERDAEGRPSRSLAVLIDVTDRNRSEERARGLTAELERRVRERTSTLEFHSALLRALLETSLDGILVVDPVGKILYFNGRFAEMWGIAADVLATEQDQAALAAALPKVRDPEAFLARVKHLYDHPDEKSFDEVPLRDGRTLERYSSSIFGPGGRNLGRVWYFRDVTARKLASEALRDKNEELERSNLELETYANVASHDLAAPLGKIISFGELLRSSAGAKLEARELELLDRMLRNGREMGQLIRDILALSKVGREPLPVEAVSLERLTSELLSELEVAIADSRASISVGPLPSLRAQASLLRQLLRNLITNAIKFRSKGRAPRIEIGSREADGGVGIFVQDNGIGFEPRFAETIFEPFARLNPPGSYEGSGIGLAICRRIAGLHGGRISATSVPGQGSTFALWLPREALDSPTRV